MRQKIQMTGLVDMSVSIAEGNPGAATVIAELLKPEWEDGMMKLLHLDDMNIRGSQIWVGYKDYCGEDINAFREAIAARDPLMIAKINEECYHPDLEYDGYKEEAVHNGASFNR